MIDFIKYLMNSADNDISAGFTAGYLVGIAVFIILLTLIKIAHYLIFSRNRKVQEVKVPGSGGDLFISSSAISDMAKFVGAKFDYIDILKIVIKKRKDSLVMEIIVSYDLHGERFPELANNLKIDIKDTLDCQLGIDSIQYIDIHGKKITDKKNSPFVANKK